MHKEIGIDLRGLSADAIRTLFSLISGGTPLGVSCPVTRDFSRKALADFTEIAAIAIQAGYEQRVQAQRDNPDGVCPI